MSAAPPLQQPGSHPGSVGTPGQAGTPQSSNPMSNPSMLQQQLPPQRNPQQDAAKEKLITSIHEYLMLHGASKAAETLKTEMGPTFPHAKWSTANDSPPGFLANWWNLFYDLYCAAPERRTEPDMMSSPDAKMFHDYGFVPNSFPPPMMNGMHPQFGGPSPMMGPDGMMPGFVGGGRFGRGGGPPPGHPMGPQLMYDPRMGGRLPPQMGRGGGPPSNPFPSNMRGGGPQMGTPTGMPPQGLYRGPPPFGMDPSVGVPGPFPHGMNMNGGGPMMGGGGGGGAMSSPGGMTSMPGGPPGYMMMPTSSGAMPFGMSSGDGSLPPGLPSQSSQGGPPSHPSQSAHTPLCNGPGSVGAPAIPGTSGGTPHSAGSSGGGPMQGMMNGSELKHSPHTPRGNGGTPGPGGPGSAAAPGSVHSGGGGSVPPSSDGNNVIPKQEPMDIPQPPQEEANEITKIKQSLIEDFGKEEVPSDGFSY